MQRKYVPKLPPELMKEMSKKLSVSRLSKYGFFKLIECPSEKFYNEIILFRAVLDRALIDVFSKRDDIRRSALRWARMDNKPFINTCLCAGIEPEHVYAVFKTLPKFLKSNLNKRKNKSDKHAV